MDTAIGVIGLGIMGGSIARHLREAGYRVLGVDPDETRAPACGAEPRPNAAALAQDAEILLTSLPSREALQQTAEAIARAGVPGRTIIEASTMALEDKLAFESTLRHPGHTVLDCPISGTGAQAQTKDLVIYASGDTAAIERVRPVLAAFSRETHDLGAFGNGSRMKYVANLLVAIHNVASAEAMVLAKKAGLDPEQVVQLVTAGAGNSRIFELRAPMMARESYEAATMKIGVWQKDMAIITAFAAQLGVPTPLLAATMPIYNSAVATGHAEHDTAAVCAVLGKMAGLG